MRTKIWVGVAAAAALATVTACGVSGSAGRACTAMGAQSGVTIEVEVQPAVTYRLCVESDCDTSARLPGQKRQMLTVGLPDSVGAKEVPVRFTATADVDSRLLTDESTHATLKKFQPNGSGCEPTVYRAGLVHLPGRGLAPAK